jgi:transcriptional regulator with XRE-family HTH domain
VSSRTPSHRRVRLGIALRDAREAAGLTQTEVAKTVGRSQAWITKIESAQIARVRMTDLDSLLDAYGITGTKAEELRRFARSPLDERGVWVDTSDAPAWWSEYQEVERQARVIKAVHLDAHAIAVRVGRRCRCRGTGEGTARPAEGVLRPGFAAGLHLRAQ